MGEQGLLVASQLGAADNAEIASMTEGVTFTPAPRGAPQLLPSGCQVMIARPFNSAGAPAAPRPAGWPFDLQWIQLISAGADLYPDWLFDGPVVTLARGVSSGALAEFALAAVFAHAKRLPQAWISGPEAWRPMRMDSVHGSTLAIVGFGAIGEALAPLALALGMRVLVHRRSDGALPDGVERSASAAEAFSAADHVVLAAAATSETNGMVNRALLAKARPGVHIINVARGSLVDQEALLEALDAGIVGRATLDTTFPEPLPEGHRFYTHPNVFVSPHTSTYRPGMRSALAEKFAANLALFRAGKPLIDVVDPSRGY